ncbi:MULTISPECIES: hypothetical protein [unclassified Pseudomonas]|uniref:hypothetical protein n=1 Tax=unclassified Pseudomonas TaxID=196821 RepID=UPI000A1E772A|nr:MULTISPECIES: hypothetical protein [unclassified Pseudomonas]
MDIERLLKKKQLNVQEQNEVIAHRLMLTAHEWRERGVPAALGRFGESQGVDWSKSIVIELEIDFPGMPRLFGRLLNQDERFIAFEIDTDASHERIESVDRWEDISALQNTSVSNPGTGKGFASIALAVRRKLI